MLIHKFSQIDDLLDAAIDVKQDIKVEKSINPKVGNQVSSTLAQGSEFNISFEKNLIEKNVLRYSP